MVLSSHLVPQDPAHVDIFKTHRHTDTRCSLHYYLYCKKYPRPRSYSATVVCTCARPATWLSRIRVPVALNGAHTCRQTTPHVSLSAHPHRARRGECEL